MALGGFKMFAGGRLIRIAIPKVCDKESVLMQREEPLMEFPNILLSLAQ
jgi:hypothetical protein